MSIYDPGDIYMCGFIPWRHCTG